MNKLFFVAVLSLAMLLGAQTSWAASDDIQALQKDVAELKKGQDAMQKNLEDIKKLKEYLRQKSARDYLLWTLASNNGLRMIDILRLKVKDLIDLEPGETIKIKESKTKKTKSLKNSFQKNLSESGSWKMDSKV